jgi:hypothetical protein
MGDFSARQRQPSGRNNINNNNNSGYQSSFNSARSGPQTSERDSARGVKYEFSYDKARPPVLPMSRYPTVPKFEDNPKRKYPLSCPEEFIKNNGKPTWFETADFSTIQNTRVKEDNLRPFIQRNKNRLWKYDIKYLGQSPRDVCDKLVIDQDYVYYMKKFFNKER